MGETILTLALTVISSVLTGGLGVAIWSSWKNRRHTGDTAWEQRDTERDWADRLRHALHTQRDICNQEHGMLYKDMPPFPRKSK